jgi:predicted YcjX-like family ATPase
MPHISQPQEKLAPHSAREVPNFRVELLPMEDIYRAAGIMNPRRGYSINKVVEMVHSEHIRGLSKEMKQAAVLMALDAAGISLDQVQQDAKARHEVLDSYEAGQKKQIEAMWARKAEEVI